MHAGMALQALRGDETAQRQAQAAMERLVATWRASEMTRVIERELAEYGHGKALCDCPSLEALVSDAGLAGKLIAPLVQAVLGFLDGHPVTHVPFRHRYADGLATVQLAEVRSAALVLLAYDETSGDAQPETVSFSDVERHELVLAGAADLRIAELMAEQGHRAAIDCEPRRVVAGETMVFGANESRIIERVHGRMVVLRLARSPLEPDPSRAFRLADGELIHRASGDRLESQLEMAIALLRCMERSDAAPLVCELTREGSDHFRWQALRECLALDTSQGFSALGRIAGDPADPLATHAASLRSSLIETYPQLTQLEPRETCPA